MPITPRSSPSAQNPGPGGSVPQNQMVPQAAGNPRYKPGIGPDPNPRVVVKAVNPPVTPDQVVSMAEIPEAATIELPKIQNIKIAPVKNKTIQGHLKAIEAKMVATEKLMKDIVKLQKVQIHTEKELFERKRELYQNTFEEYLLDKTIDFEDPDNPPDCTCVNLPKKGGPGGGFLPSRNRRGRGRNRQPSTSKAPVPSTANQPSTTKTQPNQQPTPPRKEEPGIETNPPAYPGSNLLDLLKIIPFFLPGLQPSTPMGFAPQVTRDPGLEEFLRSGEFDAASQAAAPALTPEEATRQLTEEIEGQQTEYKPVYSPDPVAVNPLDRILKGFTDPPSLSEVTGLPISEDLEMALETVTMLQGGSALQFGAAKAPAIANTVRRLGVPFVSRVPGLKRLFGLSDDVAEITVKAGKAGTGAADDVAATTTAVPKTSVTSQVRRRVSSGGERLGRNVRRQRGGRGRRPDRGADRRIQEALDDPALQSLDDAQRLRSQNPDLRSAQEIMDDIPIRVRPGTKLTREEIELINQATRPGTSPQAASGIQKRLVNINKSDPSNQMKDAIDKMTKNQASGGMGDVELFNSDALNYFRGMSSKIVPMADGGFMGWFNKGVNTRIPVESKAKFGNPFSYFQKNPDPTTLFGDDALQRGQSNKNFKAGKKPGLFGRPDRAFGLDLIDSFKQKKLVTVPASQGGPMSGPTPVTRELVKRPVRAMRSNIQHPVMLALDFIINDLLLNPRSTAVYDQVTGPNAYYNDPAYKGPMPSQNLENAQSSMMSGNNDQKPEVVPLPPDYIKIPAKKKAPDFVGTESPDIEMRSSVFTRSSTHID